MKLISYKKKFILTAAFCLALIFAAGSARFSEPVSAQTLSDYGGPIVAVKYCTCFADPGVLLTIKDKRTLNPQLKIFYSPTRSLLRAYYNIWRPGPEVLGSYEVMPHSCRVTTPDGCHTVDVAKGTIDKVRGIGTTAR